METAYAYSKLIGYLYGYSLMIRQDVCRYAQLAMVDGVMNASAESLKRQHQSPWPFR